MISVRFEEFMNGEYDNKDEAHELYVLKNESLVLYVGISTRNIWERWFGSISSHLVRNYYGEWFSTSDAGRAVLENMPVSNDWTIELWTLQDCIDFLGERFARANKSALSIRYVEPYMIGKLRPSLNVIYANYEEGRTEGQGDSANISELHHTSSE
jgi:hypothetical protein